jgi:integrase
MLPNDRPATYGLSQLQRVHESGVHLVGWKVIEPRNLSRLFDELIGAAGVRRIRFHDMRHTCASLLLAQGVPPRVVMDVLGHSQIAITMDLYSHVMPTVAGGCGRD